MKTEAALAEVGFAGGAGAAAGLTGRALEKAARRGLETAAVRRFATEPLQVRVNGQSLWLEPDIEIRGLAWEAFDSARTGLPRTPGSFPVFDQFDKLTGVAVSNKTIDLLSPTYDKVPSGALYRQIKGYIARAADFKTGTGPDLRIKIGDVKERRLHLLFANRPILAAQTTQIELARQEAVRRGVIMTVEYSE